jgi:hypothetical protein
MYGENLPGLLRAIGAYQYPCLICLRASLCAGALTPFPLIDVMIYTSEDVRLPPASNANDVEVSLRNNSSSKYL